MIPINIQEAYRTPIRLDQKRKSSYHIIIKTQNLQNKERILKAEREKGQVIYKGRPARIISDFSTKTVKTRRTWINILQPLKNKAIDTNIEYYTCKTLSHHRWRKQDISRQIQIFQDKFK